MKRVKLYKDASGEQKGDGLVTFSSEAAMREALARDDWALFGEALTLTQKKTGSLGSGSRSPMLRRTAAWVLVAWTEALSVPTWSDLERRLPSSVDPSRPAVYHASSVDDAELRGKTVLWRDRRGWCPYAERVWLAFEVKNADYVTVLVDDDYSATPGAAGSLPRVQWPDGTMQDGSAVRAILERIETEHPHPPRFFPDVSVSVSLVRDSFDRFDGIMPRFTKPSSLAPFVFAEQIQRAGSFEVEPAEEGELVPKYKVHPLLPLARHAHGLAPLARFCVGREPSRAGRAQRSAWSAGSAGDVASRASRARLTGRLARRPHPTPRAG